MKVVLDTNVVVSGIFWGGRPFKVLEHWVCEDFVVLASFPILDEFVRVISEIGVKRPNTAKKWIDFITANVALVDTTISLDLCRDPADNMFIECAIAADADFVVSGDQDLLSLGNIHAIPILTPAQFLRVVDA